MLKQESKKTFLYSEHIKYKAKMIPFCGYSLPVWYSSLKEEHFAVRSNSGLFDISHMGVLEVQGAGALDFLQYLSCNDVTKSLDQKMIYSMFLNEDGGILDDVTIGKLNDSFIVVVNASNKNKIMTWMSKHIKDDIQIKDITKDNVFLALQGPQSYKVLVDCFGIDIDSKPKFSVMNETIFGEKCIIMKTGYTGEKGCELVIPNSIATQVWQKLLENNVNPCGLGARDTLRIEAGFPLYGQELSESITPLMTRYASWIVKFNKDFIGKEVLVQSKENPQKYITVGLEMEERVIPRTDYEILEGGMITSGTLSPSLDKPIGMALINPEYAAIGSKVTVQIRGKSYSANVVPLPFI
jgi:aminomethyltransferase